MEKLGRYEILEELGRGGCGVVYKAIDPGIGRTVAIKTIRNDNDADGTELRERFRREARSAGILSHPNIVTIHEFNDSGDVMYIAMEFIDGQTLHQRMRNGALPLDFTLMVMRSAAEALDFAHAHNIVHRDVKPANFLINKHGHVKIADFGIAKLLDGDAGLTSTGMVVGTARYMSPEQIAAKEVTGRSDQFSLGVIAYEMLTGKSPFQGNSWASIMHNIVSAEPACLTEFRQELDTTTTDVLRKALAKDPANRYATCKEFAAELERTILGNTVQRKAYWETVATKPANFESAETVVLTGSRTRVPPATPSRASAPPPATVTVATPSAQKPAPQLAPTPSSAVPAAQPPPEQVPAAASSSPAPANRSWIVPVAIGGVVVVGLGAWMFTRGGNQPATSNNPVVTQAPQTQSAPPSASPAPAPVEQSPAPAARASAPASVASSRAASNNSTPASSASSAASAASAASTPTRASGTSNPAPVEVARTTAPAAAPAVAPPVNNTPPPAPAPVAAPSAPAVSTPPPAAAAPPPPRQEPTPTPAPVAAATPAPARGPDPAEQAAQRRAAEQQASRKMVADAVARYRQAFESKDMDGLKAVWPKLSKNEQSSFQNFFRIAKTIKLQLTPSGDPEITGTGATARFVRSMNATDNRGTLPTQEQTVRITFRKSGDQMLIDGIEATDR